MLNILCTKLFQILILFTWNLYFQSNSVENSVDPDKMASERKQLIRI